MQNRKRSVRQAIRLGQLFVNAGVIAVMAGVWILSTAFVVQAKRSVWIILAGIFAGPIMAWPWWSLFRPSCEHGVAGHIAEAGIGDFHQAAVQAQSAWPRAHFFEKTEPGPDKKNHRSNRRWRLVSVHGLA